MRGSGGTRATSAALEDIKRALESDIEGSVDPRFGGSVRKRTYVDGISDVDTLLILCDFLWVCVRRSKLLPNGGRLCDKTLSMLSRHLKDSVSFAVRFVIAGLAAALRFLPDMPDMPRLLVEKGPIAFVAFSCLFVYWLEDAYEMVLLDGIGRTMTGSLPAIVRASL